MVLQTFIQTMLPKDAEAVYGKGMAGDMWKSLLAEQLGDAMAERGGIGIADRVLGDHYIEGETKLADRRGFGRAGKGRDRPAEPCCRPRWSRKCSARSHGIACRRPAATQAEIKP